MKVEYSPRQSGKTTKMIEMLVKDERRVLCTFSLREQYRLQELYPEIASRIIWWESFAKERKGRASLNQQRVLVDNADYILEQVIGDWIEVGTFNKEEIELRKDAVFADKIFDKRSRRIIGDFGS